MKVYNLKKAAQMLKEKKFTEKHPLKITPTVLYAWHDTRHYSEELSSEKAVEIWQRNGCLHFRDINGNIEKIQRILSFDPVHNYQDSVTPNEEKIIKLIKENTEAA